MKLYKTEFVHKGAEDVQIPETLNGASKFYRIPAGKSVTIENTDKRNYLSPIEKIIIQGPKGKERCKVKKRANWNDPFKDSPRRTEMLNFGGFQFLEVIFVQEGNKYLLPKGIPVVCETQPNTWIEKYKSIKIEEPYNRQMPSREYPGEIDVIQVQNIQYETREEAEIEEIRKRRKEEKNKIRV
jgi:hypothetical protein